MAGPRVRAGRREPHEERGQTVMLVPIVLIVFALGVSLVVGIAEILGDRARAQTAADAAALAAAADGPFAAERVAARNGASVHAIRWHGAWVEVEVILGTARAVARAERVVELVYPP